MVVTILQENKKRGHTINHKRVSRLMHEMNLKSKIRKATFQLSIHLKEVMASYDFCFRSP